jgi:hypothetical protein
MTGFLSNFLLKLRVLDATTHVVQGIYALQMCHYTKLGREIYKRCFQSIPNVYNLIAASKI